MRTEKEKLPERFAAFDVSAFGEGDTVVYRSEGKWQVGRLVGQPQVTHDKNGLILPLQKELIYPKDDKELLVEVKSAPRKVLFKEYDEIEYKGHVYEVKDVAAGPSGEVWYDLISEGVVKPRVNQELIVADQKLVHTKTKLDTLTKDTEKDIESMVEKIKHMKDKTIYDYLARIQKLKQSLIALRNETRRTSVNMDVLSALSGQLDEVAANIEAEKKEINLKLDAIAGKKGREDKIVFNPEEGLEKLRKTYDTLRTRVIKIGDPEFLKLTDKLAEKIKKISPSDPEIAKILVETIRDVHDVDLEITELEFRKKIKVEKKERQKKVVDIPAPLMSELINAFPGEFKALLEKIYENVVTGEGEEATVAHLTAFFDAVAEKNTEGSIINSKLKEQHIYFEEVMEQLDGKALEKCAKSLRHAVEQQVKYWSAQKLYHLRGKTGLPLEPREMVERFYEWKDTSPLARMPKIVLAKLFTNTVILGGVGWATNKLFSVLSDGARGAVVGAVVGVARAGLQHITGNIDSLKEKQKRAAEEGLAAKKSIIKDYLLERTFTESGDTTSDKNREWGHVFSSILRRATLPKDKMEVVTGGKILTLEKDEALAYHHAMYRAEHDAGLDAEKLKYSFIKGLHALRYNGKVEEKEDRLFRKRNVFFEKIKWLKDVVGGTLPDPKPIVDKKTGKVTELNYGKIQDGRYTVPALVGALVGYAIADKNDLLRGLIGATYGFQRGYLGRAEEERGEADMEARKQIKDVVATVQHYITMDPGRITAYEYEKSVDYYKLLVAISRGQETGLKLDNIDSSARVYFLKHHRDAAQALDRDVILRTEVESLLYEIHRSGLLERMGFYRATEVLAEAGNHSEKGMENVWSVRWGREAKRWVRGVLYGAAGAAAGFVLGKVVDKTFHESDTEPTTLGGNEPVEQLRSLPPEMSVEEAAKITTPETQPILEIQSSTSHSAPEVVLEVKPVVDTISADTFVAEVKEFKFQLRPTVEPEEIEKYAREWAKVYAGHLDDNFVRQEFRDWVLVDKALNPSAPVPVLSGYEPSIPTDITLKLDDAELFDNIEQIPIQKPIPSHEIVKPSEVTPDISDRLLSDHHPVVIKPGSFTSDSYTLEYFDPANPSKPLTFEMLAKYEPTLDPDGVHVSITKNGSHISGLIEAALVDGEKAPIFKVSYADGVVHKYIISPEGKLDSLLMPDGAVVPLKQLSN